MVRVSLDWGRGVQGDNWYRPVSNCCGTDRPSEASNCIGKVVVAMFEMEQEGKGYSPPNLTR